MDHFSFCSFCKFNEKAYLNVALCSLMYYTLHFVALGVFKFYIAWHNKCCISSMDYFSFTHRQQGYSFSVIIKTIAFKYQIHINLSRFIVFAIRYSCFVIFYLKCVCLCWFRGYTNYINSKTNAITLSGHIKQQQLYAVPLLTLSNYLLASKSY